jgi:hypothetical protein
MPILIAAAVVIVLIIGTVLFSKNSDPVDEVHTETPEAITRPTETGADIFVQEEEESEPEKTKLIEQEEEIEKTPNPITIKEEVSPVEVAEVPEPVVEAPVTAGTINGTFSATGNYITPSRIPLELAVILTVENNTITDASVSYEKDGSYATPNQARFDGAYKTEVIGKNIKEVSLSRVGGASLTTNAFNEAVAKIIDNAS